MNSPQGEIQVSVLKTLEGEEGLREHWNALVLQMETPQVFFTYEWALAVERAFKSTIQPRIFTFSKHDKLIGIAALAWQVSDPQRMFFLGASTGDYCDVVSAPNDREEVVSALFKEFRKSQVHEVFLASIPEESNTLRVLQSRKGYWSILRSAYTCRRILFDQANADAVTKPVKTERLRRLAKLGESSLHHLRAKEEIAPALDSIVRAQISRFLITNRLSPLLKRERREFLAEVNNLLSPQRRVDLSVLKLDGQDIAWHFGFQFEGTLSWYLPTFDSSLEVYSPGACLLNLVSDENRSTRVLKEIDLGLGDESYKEHFANAQRQTFNVHLSANLVGHIRILLRNAASKAIKKFPSVERFVRVTLSRKSEINKSSEVIGSFRKIFAKIFSSDETIFFESSGIHNRKDTSCQLQTLDWHNLATLAMQNNDDPEMLEYLRETAPRIRTAKKKNIQGFVVEESNGKSAQYFWVNDIPQTKDRESQSALIFDLYTPASVSGKEKSGIECVAAEIRKQGRTPWISVNKSNKGTLHSLKTSSFIPRYATIRRKFIFSMPSEKKIFHPQSRS